MVKRSLYVLIIKLANLIKSGLVSALSTVTFVWAVLLYKSSKLTTCIPFLALTTLAVKLLMVFIIKPSRFTVIAFCVLTINIEIKLLSSVGELKALSTCILVKLIGISKVTFELKNLALTFG